MALNWAEYAALSRPACNVQNIHTFTDPSRSGTISDFLINKAINLNGSNLGFTFNDLNLVQFQKYTEN